ncbi:hypothetical protein IX51_09695 [uncultured archaeon]|nr:hypothetical protein IX51_09695 [uncultured archaeon]
MAEFNCYVCSKKVLTGEKFTFTKDGAVHFDCFVSKKRSEIEESKVEQLRVLSLVLDSELQHLLNVLGVQQNGPEIQKENIRLKYKDVEKAAGETTKLISSL